MTYALFVAVNVGLATQSLKSSIQSVYIFEATGAITQEAPVDEDRYRNTGSFVVLRTTPLKDVVSVPHGNLQNRIKGVDIAYNGEMTTIL